MATDVIYDPDADALAINFGPEHAIEGEEVSPGVILHFDDAGRIVSIEVLNASKTLARAATALVSRAAE